MDNENIKRILKNIRIKSEIEIKNIFYGGRCYLAVNDYPNVVLAVNYNQDNRIDYLRIGHLDKHNNQYVEKTYTLSEIIDFLKKYPDTIFTPALSDDLTPPAIHVVKETDGESYLRTNHNSTEMDNLANLPNIQEWKNLSARQYLYDKLRQLKYKIVFL